MKNKMKKQGNAIEQTIAGGKPAEQTAPAEPQDSFEQDAQGADFAALVDELYALVRDGGIPEGFDLQAACADSAFVGLVESYGAEAAVRIYDAERRAKAAEENAMQRVNERMQQRRGLPRPASGGAFASGRPDYAGMDSAAFKKMALEMKRNARRGKKVPL